MSHLTGNMWEAPAQLAGVTCRACGWTRYTLTLRANARTKDVALLARCSRCGYLRGTFRKIEALLRPSMAPRPG
jgi:NAD-dependent SIR2 family protein deacetylase